MTIMITMTTMIMIIVQSRSLPHARTSSVCSHPWICLRARVPCWSPAA